MDGIKMKQNAAVLQLKMLKSSVSSLGKAERWICVQWLWQTNFGGPGSPISHRQKPEDFQTLRKASAKLKD